jgi:hypothetical protein
MGRIAKRGLVALSLVLFVPAAALAQASITGVVRDSSGAVLPGVTVEAASPALIEKVRTVTTDGTGQYRVVDLRPGTYSVTFTLAGFNTFRREGVELSGTFTATVNADLRVGAVEETVTVTAQTALVDVQSTTQQRVIGHEVADAVPSSRMPAGLGALIPGMQVAISAANFTGLGAQEVGGAGGDTTTNLSIHGGQNTDFRMNLNGLSTGWANETFETGYTPNMSATQEITIDAAAVSAESAEGGVRLNIIPRDGGNLFNGTVFGSYASEKMAARNLSDDLKQRGLLNANTIKVNGDFNPGFGGPIRRDRLWFYTSARYLKASAYVGGMATDTTATDPRVFRFNPDIDQPVANDAHWKDAQARLTWQATQKNKFAFSWSQQNSCKCPSLMNATTSREAGADNRWGNPQRIVTGDWTAPMTSRLLLEAGALYQLNKWGWFPYEDLDPAAIPLTEQIGNINFKARASGYRRNVNDTFRYRLAASYVTGAHAFKVGFANSTGGTDYDNFILNPVAYRLNNGIPNQLTLRARPYHDLWELDADIGLYAQDRWTVKRLTLSGGVRLDYKKSHFPEQHLGPSFPLLPTRNITFAERDQLAWKDLTPKLGAAYDLLGNGRTALKVTLNKYLSGRQVDGLGNPVGGLVLQTTRNWTDTNGNFFPDCDLTNPADNGECRTMANPNFGKEVGGTVYEPETLRGWGVREYNWEFSTGVQHELVSGLSVDIGYFSRWYGNLGLGTPTGNSGGVNFITADDRTLTPADFDSFCITAPSDPRLPGGGGYQVCGLYDLKPAKFGVPSDEFVTFAKDYGKQVQNYKGVDLSTNARLPRGIIVQGGVSLGKTTLDVCEVVDALPEMLVEAGTIIPRQHCRTDTPFLTQFKMLGSYTVPRIDVRLSASFQSIPGPPIQANLVVPNATVRQSLGRDLAGGAQNITVNIIDPGTMYGDRLNQLDMRVSKLLRTGGRRRMSLNVDVYNVLNSNAVQTESNVYSTWRRPQSILVARFAKVSAQFDF